MRGRSICLGHVPEQDRFDAMQLSLCCAKSCSCYEAVIVFVEFADLGSVAEQAT